MRIAAFAAVLVPGLVLVLPPSAARAQACSVSADRSLAFGNYVPSSPIPRDTSANIVVSCNHTVGLLISYGIRLQSASRRTMAGTSGTLSYMLATDPLYTDPWTDSSSVPGSILLTALSLFGTRQHPVYGRIPTGQMVRPGSYADNLVITLTY